MPGVRVRAGSVVCFAVLRRKTLRSAASVAGPVPVSVRMWACVLATAGVAVAGCSSAARPRDPGPAPEPQVLQAASVASREFGQLAGGGWAQAWSLWSDSARATLSQADFVRLNTECRPALGQPYVIDATTSVDATTARVDWHRGSVTGSDSLVYEGGAWRFVPDAATLAEYRLGVEQLVGRRKAAGQCH